MTQFKSALLLCGALALVACSNGDGPGLIGSEPATAAEIVERTTKEIADMKPAQILEVITKDANNLADTLSGVSDEASARQAAAQLRAMGPRLEAMSERLGNMDKSEFSLSLNTLSKMQDAGKAQLRIAQELGRISTDHPELVDIFKDEFGDIELKLQ